MTRDEIYDHLAQVYLGKRKRNDEKKKQQFNAWLVINIIITLVIFSSAFYGLTAFFSQKTTSLQSKIIFSLHHGRIFLSYDFKDDLPPVQSFALSVPEVDVSRYSNLKFSIRAREEGSPGTIKVVINNRLNETAAYYVQGIGLDWREYSIPLDEFRQITDWETLKDVSFVLESWNVDKKKGILLIDDVQFTGAHSS